MHVCACIVVSSRVSPNLFNVARFSACNIEKLGVAWGRGYMYSITPITDKFAMTSYLASKDTAVNAVCLFRYILINIISSFGIHVLWIMLFNYLSKHICPLTPI